MDIYIHNGSEPVGPFTPEELSELWRAGEIAAHAYYWYEGMPGWLSVAQFQAPPADGLTIKPRSVIVTTAPSVANREIDRERDIVTAEHAIATTALQDFANFFRDIAGGRSNTTQDTLKRARVACLRELREAAAEIGADAVIAVDLSYSQLTGHNTSMLLLVASGTAVKLKPVLPAFPG